MPYVQFLCVRAHFVSKFKNAVKIFEVEDEDVSRCFAVGSFLLLLLLGEELKESTD